MNSQAALAKLRMPPRYRWLLCVIAVLAGGLVWYLKKGASEADLYITLPVTRGNIEQTVSAVGVLQPLQYVDVGTQVTGQLKTLHVDIGDQVKQKDLVAEIDPTLLSAKRDETKASLQNIQAQLRDRQAQSHLAQQQSARNRQLFANNATSQETLEMGITAEHQASAQVTAFKAQIEQIKSQLQADEANLRYTRIYAPMTGTVVSLPARQGQTLVASQTAPIIMRIADLNTMTVWAQTSEADVPKVKVGMPVYFNTLGQPERRWESRVRQIYPTPETLNNVVLYDVLFDVANPDLALKPQMSTQVSFVLAKADEVLLVPLAALQAVKSSNSPTLAKSKASTPTPSMTPNAPPNKPPSGARPAKQSTYTVQVLKNGKIEPRTVTTGVATRVAAQVLSGLEEGEMVVVGTVNPAAPAKTGAAPLPGTGSRVGPGGPGGFGGRP